MSLMTTHYFNLYSPCKLSSLLLFMINFVSNFFFIHPGFLYAIGGKNELGILRSVEQFDLDKETWTFVHPMENALFDHAGTAFKDQVIHISSQVVTSGNMQAFWVYHKVNVGYCRPVVRTYRHI